MLRAAGPAASRHVLGETLFQKLLSPGACRPAALVRRRDSELVHATTFRGLVVLVAVDVVILEHRPGAKALALAVAAPFERGLELVVLTPETATRLLPPARAVDVADGTLMSGTFASWSETGGERHWVRQGVVPRGGRGKSRTLVTVAAASGDVAEGTFISDSVACWSERGEQRQRVRQTRCKGRGSGEPHLGGRHSCPRRCCRRHLPRWRQICTLARGTRRDG